MEAIVEMIAAVVVGFVQALFLLIEAVAALASSFLEFLFLAVTQGVDAATDRYRERRAERTARQHSEANQLAGESKELLFIPTVSPKQVAFVAAIVVAAIGCAVAGMMISNQIRERRIEATRIQVTRVADSFADQVRDPQSDIPQPGKLSELDAWHQELELFVDKTLLGSLIVVRSMGPDRESGTIDDIIETRGVQASAKEVGKDLATRGAQALRDRVRSLLPGAEHEKSPAESAPMEK